MTQHAARLRTVLTTAVLACAVGQSTVKRSQNAHRKSVPIIAKVSDTLDDPLFLWPFASLGDESSCEAEESAKRVNVHTSTHIDGHALEDAYRLVECVEENLEEDDEGELERRRLSEECAEGDKDATSAKMPVISVWC